MKIRLRHVLLLIVMIQLTAVGLHAQVQLLRHVIANGGTASIGANGAIAGTIGQTIIGTSTSSSHAGFLGFWYTYPRQTVGDVREDYSRVVTGASASLLVAPNPVVNSATITVTLPTNGDVTLKVFTAVGEERLTLIDGYRPSGTTTVHMPASELASGYYTLVLLTAGTRTSTPMRVLQ